MADKSPQWWRVECNADGKIVSVRKVEAAEDGTKTIHYVQAWHEIDARTLGRQAYNAYMRGAQQRRRERLINEGKCAWCGEHSDREPGKRCSVCAARDAGYGQRARDKAAGRPVAKLDRRTVLSERREQKERAVAERAVRSAADNIRLEVLEEVRAAWMNNRTVGAFSTWLNSELQKLTGKEVA